ncbi:MAG: cytochrome c biogenesis protein CcsA [Cytophagaceae bacterium]|nr:cytochrome c biogenesis protein CcsA [Cytophagaceae bacterium]MDW8456560.1 cytochrome c biogenesis protein CcsA [Cytophagaceae bacterium]
MLNFSIGDSGHLFVVLSFVSALVAGVGFACAVKDNIKDNTLSWTSFAKIFFYVHAASVLGTVICLFIIIYTHRYEYHYAWSHSSNNLPVHYMISCFWEGQEGSFLLWIFWHVLVGVVLLRTSEKWTAPVMTVLCAAQAVLVSMIIGVVIPWINSKIGSSPFILMKEHMPDLPVYRINPNFVAKDGSGLNPLLQNYWMVIHPPTLFLGFALCIVPFSYSIAGLWVRDFTGWIRPAIVWALVAALVLGLGILMGAYWAYETLNFEGYWNWDPVENAVYVPWLLLIASIHILINYKSTRTGLKASYILLVSMYFLILYSTFLTRSGILGESSVHSFTDLGLSAQLIIAMLIFTAVCIILLAFRWKHLPVSPKEESVYTREFWIFIGVAVLCLSAFQVLAYTSIPVYNSILKAVGIPSNLAPPADQVRTYSQLQIWFTIVILIIATVAQHFWWYNADRKKIWHNLTIPISLALLLTSILIIAGELRWTEYLLNDISYILLILSALFALLGSISVMITLLKKNKTLSGGAVAHIGMAIMILGILYSSAFTKTISINTTGLLYSKQMSAEENTQNILLFRNDPQTIKGFTLEYVGKRVKARKIPGYVHTDFIFPLDDKGHQVVAVKDLFYKNKKYFSKGDTLSADLENIYYEIRYVKTSSDTFTLYPRLQKNKEMGNVVSPDIKKFWNRDIYSYLSMVPLDYDEREWSPTQQYNVHIGDTIFINDYVTILDALERISSYPGISLKPTDIALKAHIRLLGKNKTYHLHPVYMIQTDTKEVFSAFDMNEEIGVSVRITNIDPVKELFTLDVNTTQKDFVVLKVIEKPLINLFWIGAIIMFTGMGIAIFRRSR